MSGTPGLHADLVHVKAGAMADTIYCWHASPEIAPGPFSALTSESDEPFPEAASVISWSGICQGSSGCAGKDFFASTLITGNLHVSCAE